MPLNSDIIPLLHDENPDETIAERVGKFIEEEVGDALSRAVIRPYSSPFYEARSVTLGGSGTPLSLLAYHAGRIRALISCSAGTAAIGTMSQLAGGNGYVLSATPIEIKTTDEVYVLNTTTANGAATVSVWAEYAVN